MDANTILFMEICGKRWRFRKFYEVSNLLISRWIKIGDKNR